VDPVDLLHLAFGSDHEVDLPAFPTNRRESDRARAGGTTGMSAEESGFQRPPRWIINRRREQPRSDANRRPQRRGCPPGFGDVKRQPRTPPVPLPS
jgi:hypothetical protein